ncbi:MAG: alkaline phosphatase D family protein [Bacteroidia bacterium]|nr:alkaline phosphatase D family protein [Bacteroidia bacterium]MDW8088154.1 alkaline phosphatase D family protein [Bacteroidia bacterium]
MRGLSLSIGLALLSAQPTHPNRAFVRLAQAPFLHGVASGDPLTDRVILWTRVTPPQNWTGSLTVAWEVAEDTTFSRIVASGQTSTDAEKDYTVKVEATGLQPGRWYYYRFSALNATSPIGRTRTLPQGNAQRLRIGVVSCADYQNGLYTAYENLCRRNDVDFILHLGDYIYEYGPEQNSVRTAEPRREILTLEDYRIRYSHYRLDSSLQWLHQNYPMIAVWDDHELANNAWQGGAENHTPSTEGPFAARRSAMLRAYYEWLPLRVTDPSDSLRIWRNFQWGSLAEIILLDTRHYGRDMQVGQGFVSVNDPNLNNPNRTLLGQAQRNWLIDRLKTSSATWRLVGQQVMVAPLWATVFGNTVVLNTDQWDGYPAERQRLMDSIRLNDIPNVVFLTGDIHTSWANDLPFGSVPYNPNTGAGSVAVEFVTPSITSANASFLGNLNPTIVQQQNPHVRFVNLTQHGYLVLNVEPDSVQSDWYFTSSITSPNASEAVGGSWYVKAGERFLRRAQNPTQAPSNYNPPLVPRRPASPSTTLSQPTVPVLVGCYPNPAQSFTTLQLYTPMASKITLELLTVDGRLIARHAFQTPSAGTHYYQVPLEEVPAGLFHLRLQSENGPASTYTLVKSL